MTTLMACYQTEFSSSAGWSYEPGEGQSGNGQISDGVLRATGGCWWSPPIELEPLQVFQVDLRVEAPQQLWWAAKHFDAEGEPVIADHYADITPETSGDYRSFFRVPERAATTKLLFHAKADTSWQLHELSVQPATHQALTDWWDELLASFPPLAVEPAEDRWELLPRTHAAFASGDALRVVMLGDSIINDIGNSVFELPLKAAQGVDWQVIASVRGSTGCGYYVNNLDAFVHAYDPDLVIIGGRSQTADIADIETVVNRLAPRYDVLLMSAGWAAAKDGIIRWQSSLPPQPGEYGDHLQSIATRQGVALFDLEGILQAYANKHDFDCRQTLRDPVHCNDLGRAFYGTVLTTWFGQP